LQVANSFVFPPAFMVRIRFADQRSIDEMLRASETSGQGVERLLSHLTGLRARQLNGLCLHAEIGSGLFP